MTASAVAAEQHFATKADLQGAIGELKAELRAMELRLMIRLGGLIIALAGLLFALQKLWP